MWIDSHQHFWAVGRGDYGWLTPESGPLYRDFGPDDLRPILRETGIGRTIIVQAAPTVAETRFLLDIARHQPFVAGVVGWVEMNQSETAIRYLKELASNPLLVGIRPMIQDIADPNWMLGREPARVFERLISMDLAFDALVRPQHLPALLELLGRYPQLRAVVDHGGKPNIAERQWQPWADRMAAIAEETSALCKLSGLATEARASDGAEALKPYMDHLYESFGPDRLMWGSDWPVLTLREAGADLARSPEAKNDRAVEVDCERSAAVYRWWHTTVYQWLESKGKVSELAIVGGSAMRFYGVADIDDGEWR